MDVTIKVNVVFTVSDSGLEDAMAEYDELTVEGLIREINEDFGELTQAGSPRGYQLGLKFRF